MKLKQTNFNIDGTIYYGTPVCHKTYVSRSAAQSLMKKMTSAAVPVVEDPEEQVFLLHSKHAKYFRQYWTE